MLKNGAMGAEPSNMKLNILNHLISYIFLNPVQVKPLHPLSDVRGTEQSLILLPRGNEYKR
jgi:hypothetical protein